jgi:putative Flp pilus-assembly TadE/G-like protein
MWCTSSRRRQSGQILPIAAAGFLVMCALAGLAIDASRDYLVKRDAQNAADFAVLAASKQMTLSGSITAPVSSNSATVQAAHDYAASNGFNTIYSNGCDVSTAQGFSATWFDVTGLSCGATSGFNNKVTFNSPPNALPGNPVPLACQGSGQFSCVQVVITTRIAELFTSVLGISFAYVTVAAAAQATLPSSTINLPPPNALILYQPQNGCSNQQCFDESKPVSRTMLSCTGGTNNCPTFWVNHGTSPGIYGYDGSTLSPAGDYTTIQSNGDMVIQDRTTICDPYGGLTCATNIAVGPSGFAVPNGQPKIFCTKVGGGGVGIAPPCTTTGQASLNEIDGNETAWQNPYYWTPTVDTSGLKSCGALILNGNPVYGPCANAQEQYLIEPGFYDYIVINHGTYEFDPGLYDIAGLAPVNTLSGGSYLADGIDHSRENTSDFDLCTGGLPTSCPTLTAGVWIGHGSGGFGAYQTPTSGNCVGGSSGSSGGGGDATVISGSGVVFRLEPGSGGFVTTNEIKGVALSGAGVGSLAAVGGAPLLIDEENSSFIHLDANGSGTPPNSISGLIYQTPSATAGGFEYDQSMSSGGGSGPSLAGQVMAYSFTTFGGNGNPMDFTNGYGTGSVPGIGTSGKNETSIVGSVSLKAGAPGYSVLTVNYTDEWMMDGYDAYVKINNGSPQFFSEGIWSTTPNPGDPLPPPNNNPSDQYPAYPSAGNPGAYSIATGTDWTYTIPNGNGATIEAKGSWAWGHQSDIPGAASGNYTAQLIYTFPNPAGSYLSITLFLLDGDHCGDYAYANYTFRNTGAPGPGQQTVGSVTLVG